MYEVELTESYFPAHGKPEPSQTTIGDMLRASATRVPDQPALKELTYTGEIIERDTEHLIT